MAKAKKLPSGNWRVRATKDKVVKSFTAPTKKEAEWKATEWLMNEEPKVSDFTVGECIDKYIDSKVNILSPTTISGYRKYRKNALADITDIKLCEITNDIMQNFFNSISAKYSPKTVHNAHGVLQASLKVYAPEINLSVALPRIQKKIKNLPEVGEIINAVKGNEIELPVMLAIWQGMRISEIRGAKKSDIKNGVLMIHETIVTVDRKNVTKKQTKTYDSTRILKLPQYILNLIDNLPPEQERLTLLSSTAVYKRFTRLLKQKGIEHMTFHELRHLNASVMLMLGVPDKYAMERGGWSTPSVMKSVYQHTFSDERTEVDNRVDAYFESFLE